MTYDSICHWVGAVVIWVGAACAVMAVLGGMVSYWWRHFCDLQAFQAVVHEARRQGRPLTRKSRDSIATQPSVHEND